MQILSESLGLLEERESFCTYMYSQLLYSYSVLEKAGSAKVLERYVQINSEIQVEKED